MGPKTDFTRGLKGPSPALPQQQNLFLMEWTMNVTRFDPFDLLEGFFVRPLAYEGLKLDVTEKNGAYKVTAELPGVKKEDIRVDIDGAQVTLSAEVKAEKESGKDERVLYTERAYGKTSRSFTLPQEIDEAKVEARFRDGVLELELPKKAAAQRKQITIQ